MNLTPVQFFSKSRMCRLIAATLSLFLFTAVPALADPVTSNQVAQTLSSSQGTLDLRLNTLVTQDPATTKFGTEPNGPRADAAQQGATTPESNIAGVTIIAEGQQLGVDYEEGEVEGTICDCGEIPPIIAGSFPKWSFLLLGAVPLAFINDCDDCEEQNESPTPAPTPPSNPTPTPPGVPEPGSLILLGSGLVAAGAGLRRRYAKMAQQTQEEE